jgi:hypothetical protein
MLAATACAVCALSPAFDPGQTADRILVSAWPVGLRTDASQVRAAARNLALIGMKKAGR